MMPSERIVPSTASSVATLAGITWKRLARGKALWAGGAIAGLRVVYAVVVRNRNLQVSPSEMFAASLLLLAILPAMLVGGSIAQDIEDRSGTYLWSRPLPRWAVPAAKLCAVAPLVLALVVAGWWASTTIWVSAAPSARSCLALVAGGTAASLIAMGIAIVLPKHATALTIGYMLVDIFIGALPFSLRELSISHQTGVLAHLDGETAATAAPLIAMAIVSGLWAAIGLARLRVLEV